VRFDARDYRAALAEASAALTHDPGNAEATKIKADAEARLADLDRLLAAAVAAISASDGLAAAGLLAKAQELAPGDARVAEVSARLRGLPEAARPPALPASRPAAPPLAPPLARPVDRPAAAVPADVPRPAPIPAPPAAVQPTTSPPAVTTTPPPSPPAPVDPAPRPPEPPVERRPPPAEAPAPTPPAPPAPVESDDAAIRRVIGIYERAIESKDLTLFRSVRPSLSADEERRLRAGFDQVDRQQIDIRIESIAVTGDTATVRLTRQDVVQRGGRSQTTASSQTLRLARRGGGWIIVELGR
jgi:hypothetical protein